MENATETEQAETRCSYCRRWVTGTEASDGHATTCETIVGFGGRYDD